jgi:energy-converting hydrogenase B subunit O
MLNETLRTLAVAALASVWVLGMERMIHARIQQRRGPPIWTPGFWSILKFAFKNGVRPDSPNPALYGLTLLAGCASLAFVLLFTTPAWYGILGFGSLLGIAGLMKVEEASYLFMGSLSRSVMSAGMPYPDDVKGAKTGGVKAYFEDVAAVRALKMITFGSFPFYVALILPFLSAGSLRVSDVVAASPALFSVSGLLSAFVYFIGYNIIINNRPFDIVKPKVDIIEGPTMEYAAGWRALTYVMKGLAMFALSSVFVTLYVGIPLDVANGPALALHLLLAMALPALASVLRAYSPVLTFRQIYPISLTLTLLGVAALALRAAGV